MMFYAQPLTIGTVNYHIIITIQTFCWRSSKSRMYNISQPFFWEVFHLRLPVFNFSTQFLMPCQVRWSHGTLWDSQVSGGSKLVTQISNMGKWGDYYYIYTYKCQCIYSLYNYVYIYICILYMLWYLVWTKTGVPCQINLQVVAFPQYIAGQERGHWQGQGALTCLDCDIGSNTWKAPLLSP